MPEITLNLDDDEARVLASALAEYPGVTVDIADARTAEFLFEQVRDQIDAQDA